MTREIEDRCVMAGAFVPAKWDIFGKSFKFRLVTLSTLTVAIFQSNVSIKFFIPKIHGAHLCIQGS